MGTIDFKKELDFLYKASSKNPAFIDVPEFNFLMVDGMGAPNGSKIFQEKVNILYNVSWTIKMLPKKKIIPEGWFNYVVPPLESLWWTDNERFDVNKKAGWKWTLMMMQPEFVTTELVSQVIKDMQELKPERNYLQVRLENFHEGIAIQMMHIGPYELISLTMDKMEAFMKEKEFIFNGKHHEIYFSDPRRTMPEKLKTLVRIPVKSEKLKTKSEKI